MKALSLRQPWAEWVVSGRKTLELRTWKTDYRGPLAIHASQTVQAQACLQAGIDPRNLPIGAVVGQVDLVDIIELDAQSFANRATEHLATGFFQLPLYGWILANPRRFDTPISFSGRMSLFNVPDELFPSAGEIVYPSEISVPDRQIEDGLGFDSRLPFELRVLPEPPATPSSPAYRLALYQRPVEPPALQLSLDEMVLPRMRQVIELSGSSLRVIVDTILEALRLNGYTATDLGAARREPFRLSEDTGVRLALTFLAVRPVSKVERMEAIARGIRAMTGEELYYWFSKCTSGSGLERAQKALRLLLAEE